jgi:small GTP-binding protein
MVSASPIARLPGLTVASTRARVVARRRSARPVASASSSSSTIGRRLSSRASPLAGAGSHLPVVAVRRPSLSRRPAPPPSAIGKLFGRGSDDADASSSGGLFAAKKRSQVRIPGFVFTVTPADAADESRAAAIEAAVAAGATAVILSDTSGDATTRELFDAALALKESLRGRAALLVADRTDIAASAEADGVLIGDDGVPVVVARKSLAGPTVVACAAKDAAGILVAAKEGADLVLAPSAQAAEETRGKISTPVFAPLAGGWDALADQDAVAAVVAAGAQGFAFADSPTSPDVAAAIPAARDAVADALSSTTDESAKSSAVAAAAGDPEAAAGNRAATGSPAATGGLAGRLIDGPSLALLERERALLDEATAFLSAAAPALEEIDLLVEARKGLEELFLLVIVGEFNAGKSSVINAVLGKKHLKEGILPTTNEITVLRHGDEARTEQSSDGFYTQYIPADLLREVNIVDTPGTNVILERQQRLTEEFVPRADLVLFVLSADRPMTESEVKFLKYIRKWGKKVLFVVNKCDRLDGVDEVNEVRAFVADNAERLLGVTDPAVMPVSAKNALERKQKGRSLDGSGFDELEEYVLSFLGGGGSRGGGSRGGEGMRLKLGTPLQVGTLLFDAAEEILAAERAAASAEVAAAVGVDDAMDAYVAAMEADFGAQLDAVRSCVLRATARADDLLDTTLRLTNGADLFATYVLGNGGGRIREGYGSRVLGDAEAELRAALAEHTGWLARNNERQLTAYEEAVRSRGFDPALTDLNLGDVIAADGAEEAAEVEAAMAEEAEAAEAAAAAESEAVDDEAEETDGDASASASETDAPSTTTTTSSSSSMADALAGDGSSSSSASAASAADLVRKRFSGDVSPLAVAAGFNNAAAARLLEDEVREAVYSTVGAAGAAFFFAVFLSGFLDSLAEDVLAFSLTAAVGYVSVLSLPLKRAETKAKVRAAAEDYLGEVEAAMRAEFERKTTAATRQVRATVAPWVESATAAEASVVANQNKRDALKADLDQLQRDVQSL